MSDVASIYSRWQNLEARKAEVAEDLKELFAEAKAKGHDTKALRAAFRLADHAENETDGDREHAAKVDLYLAEISGPRAGRADARVEIIEEFAADGAVNRADPGATTDTSGDDLREPTAVVSGQITGEGDAPRETGRRSDGVASRPGSDHEMDGGAIAAVKGQARPASVVDAEPSPSSILRETKPFRPFCQNRESCAGYGHRHCYTCGKIAAAHEAVPA